MTTIKIYDHNIRTVPSTLMEGEKEWSVRKIGCINSIRYLSDINTVVCLQEVMHQQLTDIMMGLGDNWAYAGVARDDGATEGEYSPVIFRKDGFKLVATYVKWLSPTPDKISTGWGAHLNRIVTVAKLQHLASGKILHVLCTHFDHQAVLARTNSAHLVCEIAEQISGPLFLSGDFNASPFEECYSVMEKTLSDSSKIAPIKYGHKYTYCGFSLNDGCGIIDYIWTNNQSRALKFGVLPAGFDGVNFSDHRVLLAEFEI